MIGVLALQGDYEKHIQILDQLDMASTEVRYPEQLDSIEGLIIPGGESTTMTDMMQRVGFHNPIREFSKKKPILGTCAGLIIMAKPVDDSRIEPLAILDVDVDRNAYGRQVHSFTDQLPVTLNLNPRSIYNKQNNFKEMIEQLECCTISESWDRMEEMNSKSESNFNVENIIGMDGYIIIKKCFQRKPAGHLL